jgi:hypothetical protein
VSSRIKIIVAAGLVGLVGLMVYLSVSGNKVSCEVCIEFGGRTECRRASAQNAEEAQLAALNTACYLLSGGISDGISCRNSKPKSASCQER